MSDAVSLCAVYRVCNPPPLRQSALALAAAAAVSLGLIAREVISGRTAKILEIGTCLLFVGLAGWLTYITDANWPAAQVKLLVDVGLMAVVLYSLIVGKPFTLQYAR